MLEYSCIGLCCAMDHDKLSPSFYDRAVTERDVPKVWVHWKEMIRYDHEEQGRFAFEELMREYFFPPADDGSPDVWILSQLSGWIYAWPKAQAVEHLLFQLRARDWGEAPEYTESGELRLP